MYIVQFLKKIFFKFEILNEIKAKKQKQIFRNASVHL